MTANTVSSIRDTLSDARRRLAGAVDDPYTDARVLASHVLRRGRAWLIAHADETFPPPERAAFERLLDARASGKPVAYLLQTKAFWNCELKVTPRTLIPRPETECLVERALALALPADAAMLDFGTGSGAIAIAIATTPVPGADTGGKRPGGKKRCWRIDALDSSRAALDVARENARKHHAARIRFRHAAALDAYKPDSFHLIVSNPPYVAEDDPHLTRGDVRFEPTAALVAGADGMECIAYLIHRAPVYLRRGGMLLLEHGFNQGRQTRRLMRRRGYTDILTTRDLSGHERVTGGVYQ